MKIEYMDKFHRYELSNLHFVNAFPEICRGHDEDKIMKS